MATFTTSKRGGLLPRVLGGPQVTPPPVLAERPATAGVARPSPSGCASPVLLP
jgi:hypothetical protein